MNKRRAALALSGLAALAIASGDAGASRTATAAASGNFKLSAGKFRHGRAGGSYFRMVFPGGGRYFKNPDSRAADKSYTLLRPGSAGGLTSGRYQQHPVPAFDGAGNSQARAITRPEKFAGILFGVSTEPRNAQTGGNVPAPAISVNGHSLSGQVLGFTATWNKLYFSQGSGSVSGRYNPRTHAYLLIWTSLIKGGPFNGFTGYWHLQGRLS
jgi:hypothetical protein